MNWIITFAASFFSAILASMGMGGGGILLIYLTLYLSVPQLAAQGINLIFFLPIALTALLIHSKNKLVLWKVALPSIPAGIAGVFVGSFLANMFGNELLSKLFGGFLLIIGIRELMAKEQPGKNNPDTGSIKK